VTVVEAVNPPLAVVDLAIDGLLPKPYDLPALKGMLAKVAGVRVKA